MMTNRILRGRYCIGDSIAVWYNPAKTTEFDPMIESCFLEIYVFHNQEQMIEFIHTIETERIFLILFDDSNEDLIKSIHDLKQIAAIYNLSKTKLSDGTENLFRKFQGNFDSIEDLCRSMRKYKRQTANSQTKMTISKLNDNEIEPAFIYAKLLTEILLKFDYTDDDKNSFVEYVKSQCPNSSSVQSIIRKLQDKENYSAISCYTCESNLYLMLNGALRNQDIDVIHKLGFFIRDLHEQLRQIQSQSSQEPPKVLYRSQSLSPADFQRIQSTQNGIISFHQFLSTTRDENYARFLTESAATSVESVGILFQMNITGSINDIPFASIDEISNFGSEEAEVLFSMNTIFRIGQIEYLGPNFYRIHLTLVNNEDQEIQQLIQYLREEITMQDNHLCSFGQLTLRMQEWPKAIEIYESILKNAIDNQQTGNMAHAYHQLGYIDYHLNKLETALDYLQKSLTIYKKYGKMYASAMADTYSMIGQVQFEQKKDLEKALENIQHALEIRRKQYNTEPQTLAKNYTQIGETLLYLQRRDDALDNLKEALKIQDTLPKYHMDLASTYSTISHVHHDRKNYEESLDYCRKALDIYTRCLRPNHPNLAVVHDNMANNLGHLRNFNEAISHANKAINISLSYLPVDHEDVIKRQQTLRTLETAQQYQQQQQQTTAHSQ
ncbi:unnamed protein product [Adineta ricciae]|uniref:Uncharacterized protein n=1 Tax=Adineta ricciae TaxID=249248 RepID=A0A814WYX5_ADIRI|nr:unnamed protein product [Adineta ricciae]CAF1461575.1 unnamed protein product [Adineta ricciae]